MKNNDLKYKALKRLESMGEPRGRFSVLRGIREDGYI